jgi:succinate-semialdehyde dehydrogenase/glutarate-semialdehyde dehydrogenase
MCDSTKVAALSFTGSTRVGKILYRQCANTVKKISLELGGNAPFIVFDSADLDLAVTGCLASKFRNAGQTCVSSNRIFVQSGVYDRFVEKLRSAIEKQIVVGDGMDQGVNQGPMVNARQLERVASLVSDTVASGAKLVMGGSKHHVGDLTFQPTILTGLKRDMPCFKEEIFGPVLSIMKFDSEEVRTCLPALSKVQSNDPMSFLQEVLELANDCRVGLAGYFYSNDVRYATMCVGEENNSDHTFFLVQAMLARGQEAGGGHGGRERGVDLVRGGRVRRREGVRDRPGGRQVRDRRVHGDEVHLLRQPLVC